MSKLGYKIERKDRLINLHIIGAYKIYATMHTLSKMLIAKIRASSHYKRNSYKIVLLSFKSVNI